MPLCQKNIGSSLINIGEVISSYYCFFLFSVIVHRVKNIPDIFDSNLNKNYQIFIIFGVNIPDTTCH